MTLATVLEVIELGFYYEANGKVSVKVVDWLGWGWMWARVQGNRVWITGHLGEVFGPRESNVSHFK
jgi:hypothetical protein